MNRLVDDWTSEIECPHQAKQTTTTSETVRSPNGMTIIIIVNATKITTKLF